MTRTKRMVSMTALAIGAAAILGTALPVAAQTAQNARATALFDRLDADDNGSISLEEFTARSKARFETLDTDGDGAISAEEAKEMGPAMRNRSDDRRWGRGNREARGYGRQDCQPMGGGYGMQRGHGMGYGNMGQGYGMGPGGGMGQGYGMGPGRGGMQGGPGMQGGGYGMFGGMQGTGPMGYGGFGDPTLSDEDRAARAEALVEMLDADGDGKLSSDEMASRPGPQMIFDRVDADGDGTISKEEFDAAAKKFGGRFGNR